MSEYLDNLSKAIAVMHECRCIHFGSEEIEEKHDGETVWQGQVEIFQLEGHPDTNVAYGWGWTDDEDEIQFIGVLNVPPIESASDAVQAAIASGTFK